MPRILFVDDDMMMRETFRSIFQGHPLISVSYAVDGQDAVEQYEKSQKDNVPFDVIIMDYYMPKLTGDLAASQIRKLQNIDSIPVILGFSTIYLEALAKKNAIDEKTIHEKTEKSKVETEKSKVEQETVNLSCFNDFLQKPLNMENLGAKLDFFLPCLWGAPLPKLVSKDDHPMLVFSIANSTGPSTKSQPLAASLLHEHELSNILDELKDYKSKSILI